MRYRFACRNTVSKLWELLKTCWCNSRQVLGRGTVELISRGDNIIIYLLAYSSPTVRYRMDRSLLYVVHIVLFSEWQTTHYTITRSRRLELKWIRAIKSYGMACGGREKNSSKVRTYYSYFLFVPPVRRSLRKTIPLQHSNKKYCDNDVVVRMKKY
jgi:hypothetical protein